MAKSSTTTGSKGPGNGDRDCIFTVSKPDGSVEMRRGIGSFHKSLEHDKFGEVEDSAFQTLLNAVDAPDGLKFHLVSKGDGDNTAQLTNPRAGLAHDRLTRDPKTFTMPVAPKVLSSGTAAEMTELYWMALLRDEPLNILADSSAVSDAVTELNQRYGHAVTQGDLMPGTDLPGGSSFVPFTPQTLFRLGLPGDSMGPMISQFLVRPVSFGTQTIDQRQRPYRADRNYLADFSSWLIAQNSGKDIVGQAYGKANEDRSTNYEDDVRYISTMRDMARFVNKDALHQAYFNACLIMLSGGAKWTPGNPYSNDKGREAGFGVLGGPHILALVSEVATRALKVVWHQKWQVHLRLRPEAYGGLVQVQNVGVGGETRGYGLPAWVADTKAARAVYSRYGSYLLPMAFSPGSPTHPAYGAGHATVAGACVTILKAFFQTIDGKGNPIPFATLTERDQPYGRGSNIVSYVTGSDAEGWGRFALDRPTEDSLTIEGELNKLAQNVAMGRSMGGVHWRTDNARSLVLGEQIAAEILLDIAKDVDEAVTFTFRSFARKSDGDPKTVSIDKTGICVDGTMLEPGDSI